MQGVNITSDSTLGYRESSITLQLKDEQESSRPVWKSKGQYVIYFIAYCIDMRSLSMLIYEDAESNPEAVIQTMLVCICVGGPLVFLECFIGQYTKKGCIAIGSMLPAMYGFGYSMLMISFYNCTLTLYHTAPSLIYIFSSIMNYPEIPWMLCSEAMMQNNVKCFSRIDIYKCRPCDMSSEACFDIQKHKLSASIFKYLMGFEKDPHIKNLTDVGLPQLKSVIHLTLVLFLAYFVACKKFRSLDSFLRICMIWALLSMVACLAIIFAYSRTFRGFKSFVGFNHDSIMKLSCWMAAFRRVTELLRLSSGGHVLLGSYMSADTPCHLWVFRAMVHLATYIFLSTIHYHFTEDLVSCRLNTHDFGIRSVNDIIFVMYATELGTTSPPQLWSFLHFAVYFVLSTISLIFQISVINETLATELKIGDHHKYTKGFLCVLILTFSIPLTTKGGNLIAHSVEHELKIINFLVITTIFLIVFLYGIQRMKDDIYFLLAIPSSWFIQTCWICSAIIASMLFILQIRHYNYVRDTYLLRLLLHLSMGAPMIMGFIFKVIQYFRRQNITGIFRASSDYGDPDPTIRMYRLLYNRRLEVRYRKKNELCKHRCLLNSEVAGKALERELILLQQIVFDLHNNEEYRGEYTDVVIVLEDHTRILAELFETKAYEMERAKLNPLTSLI